MPCYDYKCKNCSEEFTFKKSMTDETIPDCPKCSSNNVARIWGGFQLKGCGSKSSGNKNCSGCSSGSCGSCG